MLTGFFRVLLSITVLASIEVLRVTWLFWNDSFKPRKVASNRFTFSSNAELTFDLSTNDISATFETGAEQFLPLQVPSFADETCGSKLPPLLLQSHMLIKESNPFLIELRDVAIGGVSLMRFHAVETSGSSFQCFKITKISLFSLNQSATSSWLVLRTRGV